MTDDYEKKIYDIIVDVLQSSRGLNLPLTNDVSLIESGILDSLCIVEIVQQMEKYFGIEIVVTDITLDNFDTLNRITKFIESRMP